MMPTPTEMSPRYEPSQRPANRPSFDPLTLRGEYLVIDMAARPSPSILYASRERNSTYVMLSALDRAWTRGREEATRGWPENSPSPQPIFQVTADPEREGWWLVWERHPRMSMGDRVLFTTRSEIDASMALNAVRHAATLGALGVRPELGSEEV